MMRTVMLVALLQLAGSVDGRMREVAPDPRGVYVDRHIDAHVPAREGEPAATVPDGRSERLPAPDPVGGTSVMQPPPSPPAIQLYRDPLSQDRRY
jgi:hypothetical protein